MVFFHVLTYRGMNQNKLPGQSDTTPSFRTFLSTVFSYRVRSGMAAWILHRVTGLSLVLYLAIHIMGLRSLGNPLAFEAYITGYRNPLFKFAEVMLLGSVAFHAFNGLRIFAQDMYFRSERQKPLFYAVLALTIIVTIIGGLPIIFPYFITPLLP